MKLLICTQAVDENDPVLGFFMRWILEFSKHAERIEVICLKEGNHTLPASVQVHSLGKEGGVSRMKYLLNFYRYIWRLRHDYDTVFVHMNPEYLVLAGWLWRLLRKRVVLWYIHPRSSWRLSIGQWYTHAIVSATEESFPFPSSKLVAVGLGVDTIFFSPNTLLLPESVTFRVMQTARLAPVKRVECVVGAVAALTTRGVPISFDYYGEELPRDHSYATEVRALVLSEIPEGIWHWKGSVSGEEIRDACRTHDVHVNATNSGSFDKAVLESMSCGTITVVSNRALRDIVPDELLFEEGDVESLAQVLARIAAMAPKERVALSKQMRAIVEQHYSLPVLIGRVIDVLR